MVLAAVTSSPDVLTLAAGWVVLGFIALLGLAVLWYIFTQKINLSALISEKSTHDGKPGDASMSRFQFLIFTFVIATCLFLIVVNDKKTFPNIPQGVLVLLGISGSSYLVSKGIQYSAINGTGDDAHDGDAGPHPAPAGGGPGQ
jgi:uncharacterized BrkB/YihY/UPF0761 family membrane protein